MKIYQPMFFVGLGGTGCLIGAELERRLREEFCGPDGTDWQRVAAGKDVLPYQLPAFTQFVYADLNEAELQRLSRRVAPTAGHEQAIGRTQHLVHGLVPRLPTYPEVARSLRVNAGDAVADWLPPPHGEPRVSPLARGAGQLPTVGRAALIETFRGSLEPAEQPIRQAIGKLSTSGDALRSIGGRMQNACDVFVAFSVAGGTGCGIFYDYLHLIGNAMVRAGFRAQIYPLVLMPSAFDEGRGGGRPAYLNAGRALLDLFRLVDDQNGQAALTRIDDIGSDTSLSVHYPGNINLALPPSTVQTGFLFSRTSGMEREDLHRSVVSLVLSLIGTDTARADDDNRLSERQYQSFADEFINREVERETAAPSGLGNCGVSTSLVASLTVPVDDLADIITSRMLAEAVGELSVPPPGSAEVNKQLIQRAFGLANIEKLRNRPAPEFVEPPAPTKGGDAVTYALNTRARTLEASIDALDIQLGTDVPKMAQEFDPRRAAEKLLDEIDLFRLCRVMFGYKEFTDEADKLGFLGLLESRRREPKAPKDIGINAPVLDLPRQGVFRRVRWMDKPTQDAVEKQNIWYKWRAQRAWHAAWESQTLRWELQANELRRQLTTLTNTLIDQVQADAGQFARRAQELNRPRTGVSYLMPPGGHDLEPFYQAVLRGFRSFYVNRGRLRPTSTVGDIVTEICGAQTWQRAFALGFDFGADRVVGVLRDQLKQAVLRLLRHREPGDRPLLPPLADLLAAAAGRDGISVGDEDLEQFRQKTAGLVPVGFEPQGTGPLKILISYPAVASNPDIERYLRAEIHLPGLAQAHVEFQPIDAESVVVVLFRTSMAVTEVPELRAVLRFWADAQAEAQPQDYLRWRQRLGYNFDYLISTEEHRVHILHRFLCAMWNDQITVLSGDDESPGRIVVRPGRMHSAELALSLTSFDNTSSWASVLSAYELWTIKDDDRIRRDVCAQLMSALPEGLGSTPRSPGQIYRTLRKIADTQQLILERMLHELPANSRAVAQARHRFWTQTLSAALDLPFQNISSPVRGTLRQLERAVAL